VPKIVLIDEALTKLLQKENGAVFFAPRGIVNIFPHLPESFHGFSDYLKSGFILFNSFSFCHLALYFDVAL